MSSLCASRPYLAPAIFALPPSLRIALLRNSSRTLTHPLIRNASSQAIPPTPTPYIPAPKEGAGPLLTRQPNRSLPEIERRGGVWTYTLPLFLAIVTASALAFFNYQKSTSSTVSSILYALRTNAAARELLGDEIYFASQIPWISGEMSQLQGVIDISFWVKGTKQKAKTRFVARRDKKKGAFQTMEWSLVTEDGTVLQLLDHGDVQVQGSIA
jgi:cytochrome c oxidase assembly factor 1